MSTRSVTNSDGVTIVVTFTDEVSDAISNWTGVAETYERETEVTLQILGQYFLTRNQFLSYDAEIKYFIAKGLPDKDRQTLNDSAVYLNERNKTTEKKLLAESRNLIKRKILKIFNRLLQELFPSFLPPQEPSVTPVRTTPRQRTPPRNSSDADTIPYSMNEEKDDVADSPDTEEEPFDEELLGNLNLHGEIAPASGDISPRFARSRYGSATASLPQDLFETPVNAMMLLDKALETLKGKIIFEPCCGNGAIVNYLQAKGFEVIGRDLYSTEEKHDYLTEADPDYDVLITNPPFCVKHQFFEKAMMSGKPFIMLLPLQFLTPKCSYDNIKKCEINIMIMNPSPVFLNGDVERKVGDCGKSIKTLFICYDI